MTDPVRLQDPVELPVSLQMARQQLVVYGFEDDDELIEQYIRSATDELERTLNVSLTLETWQQSFPSFSASLKLWVSPVTELLNVTYYDADNVQQEMPDNAYFLTRSGSSALVQFKAQSFPASLYPRPDAICVKFKAGFDKGHVPASLKAAILMHVSMLYASRGDRTEINLSENLAYNRLIWSHRRPRV